MKTVIPKFIKELKWMSFTIGIILLVSAVVGHFYFSKGNPEQWRLIIRREWQPGDATASINKGNFLTYFEEIIQGIDNLIVALFWISLVLIFDSLNLPSLFRKEKQKTPDA